jgi:hypothetical protein
MTIHEYLTYNNVRLIDPDSSYGKKCIKDYTTKGYLHKDQLKDLREWAHPSQEVTRLKSHPINQPSQTITPTSTPKTSKARWTCEELQTLCEAVNENSNVFSTTVHTIESIAQDLNRSESAIKAQLNKIGGGSVAGELRVADKAKFVETINQLKEA